MVFSSGLEKGQDPVTIWSVALLKVFQIKLKRQKQRFQAPILVRTETGQSQADPMAMPEAGICRLPWDTGQRRMTKP